MVAVSPAGGQLIPLPGILSVAKMSFSTKKPSFLQLLRITYEERESVCVLIAIVEKLRNRLE